MRKETSDHPSAAGAEDWNSNTGALFTVDSALQKVCGCVTLCGVECTSSGCFCRKCEV